MKKTVILLIVIFSAVSAFGAVFQNKLLVELTDDSAQNVRLSGTLQGIIEPIQDETILLEPVFTCLLIPNIWQSGMTWE